MMKVFAFLVAFANVSVVDAFFKPPNGGTEEGGRPPAPWSTAGTTSFLKGDLGALEEGALAHLGTDDDMVKEAAEKAAMSVLGNFLSAKGDEVVKVTNHKIPPVDEDGIVHLRLRQYIKGYAVLGASLMAHIDTKTGVIETFNGQFFPSNTVDERPPELTCTVAMGKALKETGIQNGIWLSDCEEGAVRAFDDGLAHLAFMRLIGYQPDDENRPYQKTILFADKVDGHPLALHPQVYGARSLETWDCKRGPNFGLCQFKSNSSDPLTSGNRGVNRGVVAAHNFAIATYDFYQSEYGRDSIDDKGMTLASYANVGRFNGAFWDGWSESLTYGGGDGVRFFPWSMGCDVVAHEITHGVTQRTSNLISYGEQGGLNEAMSDIFGATVEHLHLNTSVKDTWLMAEDIFINSTGAGIRNMQDPAQFNYVDYYPDHEDSGYYYYEDDEAYNFSAIGSLAFVLMVQGGNHPRNKTNVTVPAIDPLDFDASLKAAAKIFYHANTQCLTESANYAEAYQCTLLFAREHEESVKKAWQAVGVMVEEATEVQDGVELLGQTGDYMQVSEYSLEGVKAGEAVTCLTKADNGDADLYLRLNLRAVARFGTSSNDCSSGTAGSNEACTTKVATKDTKAYAAVEAYEEYTDLGITCFRTEVESLSMGNPITVQQGNNGDTKYFALDFSDVYYDLVYDYAFIKCATFGTNGDADLFFKFGSLPSPYPDETNDCESVTDGSSNEVCAAKYEAFDGVFSKQIFLGVYSAQDYEDLAIQCNAFVNIDWIIPGENNWIYRDILRPGFVVPMQLDGGVREGKGVSCSLTVPGEVEMDIAMYVRFGQEAEPYDWSTVNACKSSTGNSSNANCTTGRAQKDDLVYVAVVLKSMEEVDDYYYYYAEMKCDIIDLPRAPCRARGKGCTKRSQCCKKTVNTCDGPPGGRKTCKPCVQTKKTCNRNSQCCTGLCKNKKCQSTKKQ